jgi:seryl-tRNA synthetase
MLDINLFRENPESIRQALISRNMAPDPVDAVLKMDMDRRRMLTQVESLKNQRNIVSKQIAAIKISAERQARIADMRKVGEQISAFDEEVRRLEQDLHSVLSSLPNLPDASTPRGVDENDNVVVHISGEPSISNFEMLPHWELGANLKIIDFDRGTKLSGSRFYVLSGAGARLQRALIAWMLDLHIKQGYLEKYTPFMVRGEVLFASGQLPKFADNLYKDHEEDFWMVPTAEVPLTGYHMDEILDETDLPLRYTAYTPCFRREKMSAGKDVRGIKRGHQFDKVEMYIYCHPSESTNELEKMRADAEQTCSELGLTYRTKLLCTGDLGFNARKTYDIEVWAPGCQEWLEVSSISNVEDFQARRAGIRFRPGNGKNIQPVHTLNGSGLGLPRTFIAVLENYQQPDGSILVPEALHPWMGGVEKITRE